MNVKQRGQLSPGCAALFGLPFIAVGVGMAVWSIADVDDVLEARAWRAVPAELDHVELKVHRDREGVESYRAVARYHYEVDGRRFTGDRVNLHGGGDNLGNYHQRTHRRLMQAWKSGEPVTVYVNPERPADAAIDRGLRVEILLFRMLFVVIFGGAGVAMLLGFVRARWRKREATKAADRHPEEPWLARPEWETGEIRSSSQTMWGALIFAVLWNLVSWPALLAAGEALRGGPSPAWLVLAFPLIGAALAVGAASSVTRRLRYGVSVLKLRTWPPRVGETVAGEVRTRVKDGGGKRFQLKLAQKERVVERSAASDSRSVRWVERYAEELELPLSRALRGGEGWTLPFSFDLPTHQPPTDFVEGKLAWFLEAKAGRGFGQFHAEFEVPVVEREIEKRVDVDETPGSGRSCPRELNVPLGPPTGPWQEEACASCGGHLLSGDGAEALLHRQGLELPTLKRLVDEMGTPSLNCPHCRTRMAQVQVRGQWVDLCSGCGALWLDDGELSALEPGGVRSDAVGGARTA